MGIVFGLFSPYLFSSTEKKTEKRYVMALELKTCWSLKDCRVCVDACHELHNVPDIGDEKEKIMWIWVRPFGEVFKNEFPDLKAKGLASLPVVLLCNHCANPPCVKVCPTRSTWKRKDGIVMMDYHRCIGCRYCMAACPYGARSFNWKEAKNYLRKINPDFPLRTIGVVEKCNFCEERLATGLLPRCVEVCPVSALKFGDLLDDKSSVSDLLRERVGIVRKPHLGTNPSVFYIL